MGLALVEQLDRSVLRLMNWRTPASLEQTYDQALPFEEVLAQTQIDNKQTAVAQLQGPGDHCVWLKTLFGSLCCHVRVQLAPDPAAPLLIYHHGFNEYPYDVSGRRLFQQMPSPSMHRVFIQAPYHDNWRDPLLVGFSSLQHLYQMFAGSLRMMQLVQRLFEEQGAAFTVVAGVSWGGMTSLLYEGMFHSTRAVIPMLAGPNLGQVIWDIADTVARPLTLSQERLWESLDFTPYYQQIDHAHVYPLLGRRDRFFRFEHHAAVYQQRPLVVVPGGHISSIFHLDWLRTHIQHSLAQVMAPATHLPFIPILGSA